MTTPGPEAIIQHLQGLGLEFRHVKHSATRTSEESAAARGEPLEKGAKAIVMKTDDCFRLFVLSAAHRVDGNAIKRRFGVKSVRFATQTELYDLTGLVPGSVPPFGRPLLDLDLSVDEGVIALERVAFNAASLTESLVMMRSDYIRAAAPAAIFAFASTPTIMGS